MKIEAAAEAAARQSVMPAAAVGDSSSVSPAVPINNPQLLRAPPFPETGKPKDIWNWQKECKRIREIAAKDPRLELPTTEGAQGSRYHRCRADLKRKGCGSGCL
ncbi:unnamed protein product [Urochloa humidicola]